MFRYQQGRYGIGEVAGGAAAVTERATPLHRRRPRAVSVLGLLLFLVLAELIGRYCGLHTPILYETTTYGYRVVPSQDIRRFGHRIFINAQGLRSETMTDLSPPAGTLRILCLGDSVTNGGAVTDQEETIPYQLQGRLRQIRSDAEVLDASAPGWAVANELGWLRDNGTYGSRYVVLIISAHDLFQPLAPGSVVGNHPAFPRRSPTLALEEILFRYLWPRLAPHLDLADPGLQQDREWDDEQANANLDDILDIARVARQDGAGLVVLLSTEEIETKHIAIAAAARLRLTSSLGRHGIGVLTIEPEILKRGHKALYMDTVHPNPEGNKALSEAVAAYLRPRIAEHAGAAG